MAEWLTVDPPAPVTGQTGGLLAVVGEDSPDAGWEHGVVFQPEGVGGLQIVDPCTEPEGVPDAPPAYEYVPVAPVSFRVRFEQQGRPDLMDEELPARVVAAITSEAVARELWTGEGTREAPYDLPQWLGGATGQVNAYLADGNAAVIGGTHDPLTAFALLEQVAKRRARGLGQPVIHAPTAAVTLAGAALSRQGNVVRTAGGTPVVADDGYPGTGPEGASGTGGGMWAYATGPLMVRLGPVRAITERAATVDRRRNRREMWGLRTFQVGFDPRCQVAVQLDLPSPTVTGG